MRKNAFLSILLILIAASCWGVIGLFSRPLAAAGLNALQTTFLRSLITAAGIGTFLAVRNRSLFRIRRKDCWIFLALGLVSIIFFNICYFLTIERTTLSAASILLYTAPCFVMLMSALFFREKITLQKLAALGLAFLGCVLASGAGEGSIGAAALLSGIGAGLGYASYSIFSKIALRKYHMLTVVFYTFLVAAVGLVPFAGLGGIFRILPEQPSAVAAALGLGVLSTIVPYICYTKGLEQIEAGKASVLAFAEPLVAALTGVLVYREALHLKNAAGILLIFAALVLLNIPIRKRQTAEKRGLPRVGKR